MSLLICGGNTQLRCKQNMMGISSGLIRRQVRAIAHGWASISGLESAATAGPAQHISGAACIRQRS